MLLEAMASESDLLSKNNLSGNGVQVRPIRAEVTGDGSKGMHANPNSDDDQMKSREGQTSVFERLTNAVGTVPVGESLKPKDYATIVGNAPKNNMDFFTLEDKMQNVVSIPMELAKEA
ncbi:hypothetical protein L6452_15245 [Arctium lappa]|uniref:Uncharacterized protein n=1 Tax=Arctium lappa TaxID=4217 RepID=A0ACB9CNA6_ARCLA|nr:hypothetical protein L6452_15245 [Arctium lappa]